MWDNRFLNKFLKIKPALLIFRGQVQKAVNTILPFYKGGELISKYLPIYSYMAYMEQH